LRRAGPAVVNKAASDVMADEAQNTLMKKLPTKPESPAKSAVDELNKLKDKVHKVAIEKKMGEVQRRQLQRTLTGKESASDMTKDELESVIKAINATNEEENFEIDNLVMKRQDSGAPIISDDPQVAKVQKEIRKEKIRKTKSINRRIERAEAVGEEVRLIRQREAGRNAMAQFEDQTGIPVQYPFIKIHRNSDVTELKANEAFVKAMSGIDENADLSPKEIMRLKRKLDKLIVSVTPEENNRIAKWLFEDAEGRAEMEPLTEKEATIANRLNYLLQEGLSARERMEESLANWLDGRNAPSDIKKNFTKERVKEIFNEAKEARANGMLKQYTNKLFDNGERFGLREYYYPSEGEAELKADKFISVVSAPPLEETAEGEVRHPPLVGAGTLKRKGKGTPRRGSVFTNVRNALTEVMIRNAIRDDTIELFRRFNRIKLGTKDKEYLKQMFYKILRRPEIIMSLTRELALTSNIFWTFYYSPITNPLALKAWLRNLAQSFAEKGHSVNLKAYYAAQAKLLANLIMGRTDPELLEDHRTIFRGHINQRTAIYTGGMFRKLEKQARARGLIRRGAQYTWAFLQKSGFGYLLADLIGRFTFWPTVYTLTKDAAIKYLNKKISFKKFLELTHIDLMMKKSQTDTAIDLLKAGRVRELANYVAETNTLDTFRDYRIPGRAGIERTTLQRVIAGIYPYPRGAYDLYMQKGIKPLFEGIKSGDIPKAKRAAFGLAKGIVGRWTVNKLFLALKLGALYSLFRAGYSIMQPGASIVADTMNRISMIAYKYSEGKISTADAIKAVAVEIYNGADDLVRFLPDIKEKKKNKK